jgi:GntR family transcriptional regulator
VRVRSDSRPLYLQAEEALKELLAQYAPGDRLPPEPALAADLGISRSTLREALRSFEDRGLVTRQQGRGTFVSPRGPRIAGGLETLESIDTLARRSGIEIGDRGPEILQRPAEPDVARELKVAPGELLTIVSRTRVAGARPVAYMVDYLPAALLALDELRVGFRGSVLDFLLARGSPILTCADARVVPVAATGDLAHTLEVAPRSPLLLIAETLYSTGTQPVDFSNNYFIPDFVEFRLVRRVAG